MTVRDHSISSVLVGSGNGAYPVLVGEGLLQHLADLLAEYAPAHRYLFISDDAVATLYGDAAVDAARAKGLSADLLSFPHGEASKNRDEWARLTDRMLGMGLGRDTVVVALGGGVTGDLAGFVAATYLRGVPVVQVPTSLVAMIDASVGGKTGVDVPSGKNLVGAFHPPRFVLVDPTATTTLPTLERAQGLAEAVKHGAILDDSYFETLTSTAQSLMDGDVPATRTAVLRSVQLKARVVSEDEREAGVRQILNFGHTLGHALEASARYRVGHGSAVAAGMILEARLGEHLGTTARGTADALAATLQRFGLGQVSSEVQGVDDVLSYLGADKKSRRGRPRYVLLSRIGSVAQNDGWSHEVAEDLVRTVLEEALGGE